MDRLLPMDGAPFRIYLMRGAWLPAHLSLITCGQRAALAALAQRSARQIGDPAGPDMKTTPQRQRYDKQPGGQSKDCHRCGGIARTRLRS
jgi:hypothetical protein